MAAAAGLSSPSSSISTDGLRGSVGSGDEPAVSPSWLSLWSLSKLSLSSSMGVVCRRCIFECGCVGAWVRGWVGSGCVVWCGLVLFEPTETEEEKEVEGGGKQKMRSRNKRDRPTDQRASQPASQSLTHPIQRVLPMNCSKCKGITQIAQISTHFLLPLRSWAWMHHSHHHQYHHPRAVSR